MNITITGSLGHISKPLTQELVQKGHSVTVISSKSGRKKEIEDLGASATIGKLEDADFLTAAFTGADAVYCMIPLDNPFNRDFDMAEQCRKVVSNYVQAIRQSAVKRVILLSSIGGHTDKGNGILGIYYGVEGIFSALPADTAITFMRPVGFYYNLLGFIRSIKTQDVIASNYGEDDKKPWLSPIDIAAAIAEELTTPRPPERKVRYVASEERSCDEIAGILGNAIGKPGLKWVYIPDEQVLNGMITAGMNPDTAKGFVEMQESMRSGELYEDYYRNRPMLGKIKMTEFAQKFAAVYRQN